jgi:hypothetical protein
MAGMLEVSAMPEFPGVRVPDDVWWALLEPAPLAAMRFPPADFDWSMAAALGFRNVVCLADDDAAYDASPLVVIAVRLQDLFGGRTPGDPEGELTRLRRSVAAVAESLGRGEGALVHCEGGTGRSGTVVGAALVTLGKDPVDVAAWLDRVHRARGRDGWPESPWQEGVLDLFRSGQ